jgi:hypothetical protein
MWPLPPPLLHFLGKIPKARNSGPLGTVLPPHRRLVFDRLYICARVPPQLVLVLFINLLPTFPLYWPNLIPT